jgi:hypothetical protein
MVTRKNEKKATTHQTVVTDYTGAFKSYDITPKEQELKEWAPARVASRSVDLPHKYIYVQQAPTPTPADAFKKISVYLI